MVFCQGETLGPTEGSARNIKTNYETTHRVLGRLTSHFGALHISCSARSINFQLINKMWQINNKKIHDEVFWSNFIFVIKTFTALLKSQRALAFANKSSKYSVTKIFENVGTFAWVFSDFSVCLQWCPQSGETIRRWYRGHLMDGGWARGHGRGQGGPVNRGLMVTTLRPSSHTTSQHKHENMRGKNNIFCQTFWRIRDMWGRFCSWEFATCDKCDCGWRNSSKENIFYHVWEKVVDI